MALPRRGGGSVGFGPIGVGAGLGVPKAGGDSGSCVGECTKLGRIKLVHRDADRGGDGQGEERTDHPERRRPDDDREQRDEQGAGTRPGRAPPGMITDVFDLAEHEQEYDGGDGKRRTARRQRNDADDRAGDEWADERDDLEQPVMTPSAAAFGR